MRTMKPLLCTFTALLLLHMSSGDRSCKIWSSAGRVVHRVSTFRVYCTFKLKCRPLMYSGQPLQPQHHRHNSSETIFLDVVNLTDHRTFSCDCDDNGESSENKLDSCGMDIYAGYPPDVPSNVSCIFEVTDRSSHVVCSWNSGRNTHLKNNSTLYVRTHNASGGSKLFNVSAKGSASFAVHSSVQLVSVWVHVANPLGRAVSPTVNFTLSDIMKPHPPFLNEVNCSSRNCTIKVSERAPTLHLDVCYREGNEEEWTLYPDSVVSNGSVLVQALRPFRLYQFIARSRFRTGLRSDWSNTVSGWTQEEAPARALDVWYAEDHNGKSMRVYWKDLDSSSAQGQILEYIITVHEQSSTQTFTAGSDKLNISVPFCRKCKVTVSARNSRGRSPPANISIRTTTAPLPPLGPDINEHKVSLYWRKSFAAPRPLEFVVEWFPRGRRLQELMWLRLGRNCSHVVITEMKPFVCYEGAVYVFYNDGSVGKHMFTGVNTDVSVPTAGPDVKETVEGSTVNVTWSELSPSQSGGCITKYTIYLNVDLENDQGGVTAHNVSPSQMFMVLKGLTPATYTVWMTASTAKGEGKPGEKIKFFIRPESHLPVIITCGVLVILGGLFLFCVCQSSAVKERVWVYFQYCKPDDIPDPANSKWAKECLQKGKVSLQLQHSTSTVSEEEEDLVLVDVLEVPRPLLLPQTSLNSGSEPSAPLYPNTTYIKSLSHDSYSSGDTKTSSLDTSETAEYISSHGTAAMLEEEGEDMEVPRFFPSQSFSKEPMNCGLKLTLNTVRIDGNELVLQCE